MTLEELMAVRAGVKGLDAVEAIEQQAQSGRDALATRLGSVELREAEAALEAVLDKEGMAAVRARLAAVRDAGGLSVWPEPAEPEPGREARG
ncbi:MAG: hypothetical protein PHZ19_11540 [Candidatus Thermoplasmatota archaeon]|nr:hypothetical protein [Candidatus Thermoplasmatota archaeon]